MSLALENYLSPLYPYLHQNQVSELCINKPGELWLEEQGKFSLVRLEALTERWLLTLAELIAEFNNKSLSETKPLLSATLPQGERCQIVLPPACEKGQFVYSIRKPSILSLTLADWEKKGAFDKVKHHFIAREAKIKATLQQLANQKQWKTLLSFAVRSKLNVIISGGTSSAKTTLLNSCLKEIDVQERLVTIEGVREVKTTLPNCVHLLANEDNDEGHSASMLDLLKVSFRLRPDRIFLSELRSHEAYPFLRACISGHPGSLTTLHADSIASAKEQLCFMLSESPSLQGASVNRLKQLIRTAIHVVVQMRRDEEGVRLIEDIDIGGVIDDF
ncbi:hypothetical protein Lnau_3113 [Legionella nautarum]|uniref:Type IV secretion system protein n=1 Tax=Legionella nautarum TaxID=45070 RepID=A0A0W0WIP3_9GAMM|nr:P-type DNA transfer ATPase VirB11 [Legionella nautarum]KTD32202.1 hypothetical protein Lnau_3113 [Legionella nautarum]